MASKKERTRKQKPSNAPETKDAEPVEPAAPWAALSPAERFAVWDAMSVSERVSMWFQLWHQQTSLREVFEVTTPQSARRIDAFWRGSSALMTLICTLMEIDDPSNSDADPGMAVYIERAHRAYLGMNSKRKLDAEAWTRLADLIGDDRVRNESPDNARGLVVAGMLVFHFAEYAENLAALDVTRAIKAWGTKQQWKEMRALAIACGMNVRPSARSMGQQYWKRNATIEKSMRSGDEGLDARLAAHDAAKKAFVDSLNRQKR